MTSTPAGLRWTSQEDFAVGGVSFHAAAFGSIFKSTPEHFFLMKPREMLEPYLEVIDRLAPRRVVELGVFFGGSTALLALTQDLDRLTAIEKSSEPIEALTHLVQTRGLQDVVRVHHGTDQGDLPRLTQIIDDDFGPGGEIDLVIDDASHELDLTRGCFELLFPRLRAGGLYIIEDWGWGHFEFARERQGPSLARLVVEIMLSMPYAQRLAHEITVNQYYAIVQRGDREVGPGPIRLDDCLSLTWAPTPVRHRPLAALCGAPPPVRLGPWPDSNPSPASATTSPDATSLRCSLRPTT